jgi:hypothetical protein
MNDAQFRSLVEEYYRRQVGSRGGGIKIAGVSARMYGNVFVAPAIGSFKYSDDASSW